MTSRIRFTALLPLLTATTIVSGQSTAEMVLLDFGDAVSFRGVPVTSPDVNGNAWNSVRPGFFFTDLLNTASEPTTIDFGPGAHPTDSYNGPAGATSNPPTAIEVEATDIDAAALGVLGVKEAAFDYIVGVLGDSSGYFQLEGLDPAAPHTLTFYGAHKYIAEGTTRFNVYGDVERTNLLGTTDLVVGENSDTHNRDQVGILTDLMPSPDGILYVEFGGADGVSSGYLNAMSISFTPVVDNSFWSDSPRNANGWRFSGESYSPATGIGWIWDAPWPWVYALGLGGDPTAGNWIWIHTESSTREGFYAWVFEGGYWIYGLDTYSLYYSFETGAEGWKPFVW